MTQDQQRIQLRLSGSRTSHGAIDFDALLGFGEAFRRAVRAIARTGAGLPPVQPGQPAAEIREASALRLVGLSDGSAVLELEPVDQRLLADPTIDALRELADGVAMTAPLDAAVVNALAASLSSLGDRASIGLVVPGREPVTLDRQRLSRLEAAVAVPDSVEPPGTVDGWLHAVDFGPEEIRVRDASGDDWVCEFGDTLEPVVRALLKQQVRVIGRGRSAAPRGRIEIDSIVPLLPAGVPTVPAGRSADQVFADALSAAGLDAPQPLESLAAETDLDDPEEVAFREALSALG